MNDPMQPEELTELLDDDLEMWAVGGTRILNNPRSQPLPQPQPQLTPSYPPVAYTPASIPPPPVATARSNAPIWAAVGGMVAVFMIAVIAGGVVLFMHRSHAETELASTTTVTTAEPETVTLTPTVTATATVTATPTATPTVTAPSAPLVVAAQPKLGAVQTWAVGNGKPIYVDGKQVGVGGARVKTACGKHAVAVGTGRAKTYDIPCNGAAIVVGTPDGQ